MITIEWVCRAYLVGWLVTVGGAMGCPRTMFQVCGVNYSTIFNLCALEHCVNVTVTFFDIALVYYTTNYDCQFLRYNN